MSNDDQTMQQLVSAVSLHREGKLSEAASLCQTVLVSDPHNAYALYLLGTIYLQLGKYQEGMLQIERSLHIKPNQPAALNNLGNTLKRLQRHDEALASYDKAIALWPDYTALHFNRGILLQKMGRYGEALASYDKAIALKPDYAEVYNNRGNLLWQLKRYNDALASYDKAIELSPYFAEAFSNLGNLLQSMQRYEEALASHEMAIALQPDIPYLLGSFVHTKMHLADWQGIDVIFERLSEQIEAGKLVSLPMPVLATPLLPLQQRKCAEIFIKNKFPAAASPLWQGDRYNHIKMRVAYISGDFREHPVSYLMAGIFEKHDKTRFELYAISLRPEEPSPTGQRIKAAFDHFVDVSQKSDQEVAQLLRNLEIDIAVDLTGVTLNYRMDIFARRAVPVQINYLGYPGTMGASYMDYIIADAFVIPPRHAEHYAEKVVYLPDCFQANDDRKFVPAATPARAKYGLPEEGFVFCSFNTSYKITPAFFDVWMRLLQQVPGSVLWLLGDGAVKRNICSEAKHRGVDPSRLIFTSRMKYEEHLTRLKNADLYLDTLPFNAGATASDVLWAGVPLLTCAGESFAGRMAGSLLTAMGLPELITDNLADYEKLALALAANPQKLAALRDRLIKNRTASPLFNTARFTGNLEDAYVKMWQKSQAG